jgi:hypothetical protein
LAVAVDGFRRLLAEGRPAHDAPHLGGALEFVFS